MNTRVVADGYERLTRSEGFKRTQAALWEAIQSRYETELASAGLWKRWQLRRQMRWELRRECRRLAPPDALYLRSRPERSSSR